MMSVPTSPTNASSMSEPSLDMAPLELTITTTIESLTPSSDSSTVLSSPSPSTPAAARGPNEQLTISVGIATDARSSVPSKCGLENEVQQRMLTQHRSQQQATPGSRMTSPANTVLASDNEIKPGARFLSFTDFERVFETWKARNYHPFRVASSETLRLPDGSTNTTFKYRYIVYHCAHYGAPRMRGVGKRPNQNYMPCGCKAMLRLNYSWSENALRVTTLNEDHIGHDATEDAYYKFAAKAKQRQSSSSPPTVAGSTFVQQGNVLVTKRPRSESPGWVRMANQTFPQQRSKMIKNGHQTQAETPLNLSKNVSEFNGNGLLMPAKRSTSADIAAPPLPKPTSIAPHSPALSVLMFNQQQQHHQNQHQQAYQELMRLLSVSASTNGNGLVTALGASGVRDCRTESERHRLIYPIMQTLTQYLASARGYEFDEKLRDLKAVLKKWQLIATSVVPPIVTTSSNFVQRSSSAAAAAAAMMVQAMSAGAGFVTANGNVASHGANLNGNGLISNGGH